jgi:hypothetical protein
MLRKGIPCAFLVALLALPGGALARRLPLLPLGRGQLTVLLGQTAQWQPEAGAAQTLTLIGGAPRSRHAGGLNAYVALQSASRACAGSARADHARLLTIGGFYRSGNLVRRGSALAPDGGAGRGAHAASADAGVLHERGSVRACVWLARQPGARARPTSQLIPLLNGLFAAAVWPTPAPARGYSLDAGAVGTGFSYSVSSVVCGSPHSGSRTRVAAGDEAADTISIGSLDCPTDGSSFNFFGSGGSALGAIVYTAAEAVGSPAVIGHLGGCDLDGLAGMSLAAARRYVAAVGCRTGRVLTAPFDSSLARGLVAEAQVDGGQATLAPAGTAVDLVTDGG